MKLVDILARDLKDWPEGADQIVQGFSGRIITDKGQQLSFYPELAEDWSRSIVTRAQWEAAVDALKAGEQAWDGEGLPPVGTVCEFAGGTPCPEDPFDKDLKEGMQVTIIAHFKSGDFTLAAFTFDPQKPDRGMVQVEQGNFGCFRPIRTAEQIAAEEKQDILDWLVSTFRERGLNGISADLHAQGYRKKVQP